MSWREVRAFHPGERVIGLLRARGAGAHVERLRALANSAIVTEGPALGADVVSGLYCRGVAVHRPVRDGLWHHGCLRSIGAAKTASLPVVAPAIGEALVTTAIGLATAIPAVFFYNWIDGRVGDFIEELEAAAAEWVAIIAERTPRASSRRCPFGRRVRGCGRDAIVMRP